MFGVPSMGMSWPQSCPMGLVVLVSDMAGLA